ncbi:class I tRNA ligase family protein, partial [Staphylococcus hominis]|uniref:class I tRNA ligase family protein n=1 Tax=Staphylococcus hominis TaxID=1290 RepID=UPI00119FB96F
ALNKIIKHIILPYKTIQPFYSPYLPRSHTHPLPIQQPLTKKPLDHKKISIAHFTQKSKQFPLQQLQLQKQHFKPLPLPPHFNNPYITL